ncbi:LapA family protein [Lichenihabitans sp. Uapishka_5]|uniref:LapA family protein n=1 Tax=Lichenihabitans sp. Uapishka_5 TaxID=3037302 RepID=UPI0029E7DC0E|nr:LapA family protein [Lichenihabitans sp. Uapishka_5]MDX7950720.1 LapA family protein [Lichenihabitans sp. Uapishka_5]
MKNALKAIVLVPIALLIVVFAVANRQMTTISLDPFNSDTPALALSAPLFLVILLMVILGVLVGGIASWISQGVVRASARQARTDAAQLRRELQETRLELDLVHRQQAAARSTALPSQALIGREVA